MRKFLSLIFALFVTLPFCTKCYAIEGDSLGDEVRHVVRQMPRVYSPSRQTSP